MPSFTCAAALPSLLFPHNQVPPATGVTRCHPPGGVTSQPHGHPKKPGHRDFELCQVAPGMIFTSLELGQGFGDRGTELGCSASRHVRTSPAGVGPCAR